MLPARLALPLTHGCGWAGGASRRSGAGGLHFSGSRWPRWHVAHVTFCGPSSSSFGSFEMKSPLIERTMRIIVRATFFSGSQHGNLLHAQRSFFGVHRIFASADG